MVDLYCKQHARPNSLGPTPQRRPCVPMSCVLICRTGSETRPVLPLPHESHGATSGDPLVGTPAHRRHEQRAAPASRAARHLAAGCGRPRVRRAPRHLAASHAGVRCRLPARLLQGMQQGPRPGRPHMHPYRTAQTPHLSPHWQHRHHRSQLAPLTPLTPHPAVATRWRRAPVPTARRPATPTAPRWLPDP